jgi:hypothetical protein
MMALNSSMWIFMDLNTVNLPCPLSIFFFFLGGGGGGGGLFPSDLYVSLYEVELLFIKKKKCFFVFFHYFG